MAAKQDPQRLDLERAKNPEVREILKVPGVTFAVEYIQPETTAPSNG